MRLLTVFSKASSPLTKVFLVAGFSVVLSAVFLSHPAAAGREVNSRLYGGNAAAYCAVAVNGGPNNGSGAKGMVWLSNDGSDYYSDRVIIGETTTTAAVEVRGAFNLCATRLNNPAEIWAIQVASAAVNAGRLTINGNEFYRGSVSNGVTYQWSSGHETGGPGNTLPAVLDLTGIAPCSNAVGGVSSGTMTVGIYRALQYRQTAGNTTGGIGTEQVVIPVTRNCPRNFTLTPTISVTPNIADPGQTAQPTGAVTNGGTTATDPVQWQVTRFTLTPAQAIPNPAGGVSAAVPIGFFGGDSKTYASGRQVFNPGVTALAIASEPVEDLAAGSKICYALSVQPYTQADARWNHSAPACIVLGKKPKVDVLGGDLRVGRSIANAVVPAAVGGKVATSLSTNATGSYGSWSEYGIIPSGTVFSMASGSGYVGGTSTSLNLLTFNNAAIPAGCGGTLGCYAHRAAAPDVEARYRTPTGSIGGSPNLSTLASGVYSGSGAITIAAATIPPGRSIIINAKGANVVITGNITYSAGPIGTAANISQLVIIANSVVINRDVTQVDAWLIAQGTVQADGSITGGEIRTCDAVATTLTTSVCEKPLRVNGPVLANKLFLLRTGGSGPAADAGKPAEQFNGRPDSYVWALQQGLGSGRLTTVSSKELPPRF